MRYIHINCDLGEGGDNDEQIMPLISACNIACGGHAGTLETMRHTVGLALGNETEIGAHPSYPDKENFGRKSVPMPDEDLKTSVIAQILSLKQIAEAEGGVLHHIKPHGALYNDAAKDERIAGLIIEAVLEFEDKIPIFVPPESVIADLAKGNIEVVFEAFADRNYEDNYRLVSRGKSNALIQRKEDVFEHLSRLFFDSEIQCINGENLSCSAQTFCLHSDTSNTVQILEYLQEKFKERNVQIKGV